MIIILNPSLFALVSLTKVDLEGAKIIKEQIIKVLSAGAGGSAAIFTINYGPNDKKIAVTQHIDQGQILPLACLKHLLNYLEKTEITSDENYENFLERPEKNSDYTGSIWLKGRNVDLTINFLEGEYAQFIVEIKQNGIEVQSYASEEFILKGYEEMLYEMAVISQDRKESDDPKSYKGSSTAFDGIAEGLSALVKHGNDQIQIDQKNDEIQEAESIDKPTQNIVKPSDDNMYIAQKNDEIQESVGPQPESNLWKWLTGFIILLVTSMTVKFLAFRK